MTANANEFSAQWFECFLRTVPEQLTEMEVAFLCRQLPNPPFAHVVDICCGEGRHAIPLARRGYPITGVDRDATELVIARHKVGQSAQFVRCGMRVVLPRFPEPGRLA